MLFITLFLPSHGEDTANVLGVSQNRTIVCEYCCHAYLRGQGNVEENINEVLPLVDEVIRRIG